MSDTVVICIVLGLILLGVIRSHFAQRSAPAQVSPQFPLPRKPTLHQFLAHSALPSALFSQPSLTIEALSSGQSEEFIAQLLDAARQQDTVDVTRDISASDIDLDADAFASHTGLLVTMPTPQQTP